MRGWVSLAQISPKKKLQSCIAAYSTVQKIWESTISAVNANAIPVITVPVVVESTKKPPTTGSSSSPIGVTTLPGDLQGWIDFQSSDNLKRHFQMNEEALNGVENKVEKMFLIISHF
jgi:hypothetical protein